MQPLFTSSPASRDTYCMCTRHTDSTESINTINRTARFGISLGRKSVLSYGTTLLERH